MNDSFLWGTATSAHQVEGSNTASDWWAWEQAGRVQEASGLACDQYRRFREDFEILSKLGHSAHRFSLEWSRFEPEENQWNDEAFRHYDEIFRELKDWTKANGLAGSVWVTRTGCLGFCNTIGATIVIYPDELWFKEVKKEELQKIKDFILDSIK